jgi:hypothetical protein
MANSVARALFLWISLGAVVRSASAELDPSVSDWAVFASGAGWQYRRDNGTDFLETYGSLVSPSGSGADSYALADTRGVGLSDSYAHSMSVSALSGASFEIWGGLAQADTSYYFYVNVREMIPPPADILSTPIFVRGVSHADVSASGISRAIATAYSIVGGVHTSRATADTGRPLDPQVDNRRWEYDHFVETDAPLLVELHSSVSARGGSGGQFPTGFASARAYADPTFEFNQHAFDEFALQQGFPTFQLSDYFEFEFSPLHPVPEPSTATLLVAGGVLLLAAACKR